MRRHPPPFPQKSRAVKRGSFCIMQQDKKCPLFPFSVKHLHLEADEFFIEDGGRNG